MRKIRLLYVGSKPEAAWEALASEYRKRLSRLVDWAEVRVSLASGRAKDPQGALRREAKALLAHVQKGEALVALDQRGSLWTTEDLARFLQRVLPTSNLVFAIGSDLGLAEEVRQRAVACWSLSPLTLPHEMARLLVMEQLYRALDWLAGGAYHRGEPPKL